LQHIYCLTIFKITKMNNKFNFLLMSISLLLLANLTFSCSKTEQNLACASAGFTGKCDDTTPKYVICCTNVCDLVVHTAAAPTWKYNAGDGFFTVTFTFDKEIDEVTSDLSNGNGIVFYKRTDADCKTNEGTGISGTFTSADSGKTWIFKSESIGDAEITNPANFFEYKVENSNNLAWGLRTKDGGVFDDDKICTNGSNDLCESKRF
jgi:hypothetical protein